MDVQAIPNQTVTRARESTENTPANRRIRDVSRKIHRLDPDAAPFTLLLQQGKKAQCAEPKYEWIEKELAAKWSQANGAHLAGDAAIVVDHARYFSVGDIVNIVRTGEKVRVTAVDPNTNTLTVVRSVGSSVAAAINDNDDLQIIGNAYAEGSPLGLEKSHVEAYLYNYVQIFRHPFGVTGTQDATVGYLGKDRPRLRAEKSIEHKMDIERTALFGEREFDGTNPNNPRRYTGGAFFFLVDNILDAGGALTAGEVWTWMQSIYAHTSEGGDSRILFASPLIITVMDQFALTTGNVQVNWAPKDKTFGLSVKQWSTSHGSFNIIKHRLLENGLGGQGYGGHGLLLDPSQWYYRHLPGRDTQLRPDVGNPGDDAWTDEYLTECGWQVALSKTQGLLKGVTS